MDSTAFLERIEALGGEFARRAPENDSGDAFVTANYAALKRAFFRPWCRRTWAGSEFPIA
jgi:hypothetical protein